MTRQTSQYLESEVRLYCRHFDKVFSTAKGSTLHTVCGCSYIDFFAGAGALNYGHNPTRIVEAVQAYIAKGGITHSLDLYTEAKLAFIETLYDVVLKPLGLPHRIQFTGPTGTNAVEAALKIARLKTGRRTVLAFTNAFHGMTMGALSASSSAGARRGLSFTNGDILRLPFEGFHDTSIDSLALIEAILNEQTMLADPPAGMIIESIQIEGGLNVASRQFLQGLSGICKRLSIPLILDDIQAGCGRTGRFFSFETLGFEPDIICLSKSLGGMGLPIAIVLLRPELDCWKPGQHTGTFRGNNLAFVAGREALMFWRDPEFLTRLTENITLIQNYLDDFCVRYEGLERRGRGFVQGLKFAEPTMALETSKTAFQMGVIAEVCGPNDEVLKFMPPLTIERSILMDGLERIERALSLHVRGTVDNSLKGDVFAAAMPKI